MAQAHILFRPLIGLFRLVGLFVFLFVFALVLAIGWFSTNSGNAFLRAFIQNELASAVGYEIDATDIRVRFPATLSTARLELGDSKGVWFSVDDLEIDLLPSINPHQLLIVRRLKAEKAVLSRVPEEPTSSTGAKGAGPDIAILSVEIKRVEIGPSATGFKDSLVGSLEAALEWSAAKGALGLTLAGGVEEVIPSVGAGRFKAQGAFNRQSNLLAFTHLSVAFRNLSIEGSGSIGFEDGSLTLFLETKPIRLDSWMVEASGHADAQLKLSGTLKRPKAEGVFNLHQGAYGETRLPDIKGSVRGEGKGDVWTGSLRLTAGNFFLESPQFVLKKNILAFPALSLKEGQNVLAGNVSIDFGHSRLRGALDAALHDMGRFLPPDHVLEGEINGRFFLSGSLRSPVLKGTLGLVEGAYRYLPLGSMLKNVRASFEASSSRVELISLRGEDNKGNVLEAKGNVSFIAPEGLRYSLTARADKLALLRHPYADGTLSGTVAIEGDAQKARIKGSLVADEIHVSLPDRFLSSIPALRIIEVRNGALPPRVSATQPYPVALDLSLAANNKFFVRGQGLDAEFQGLVNVMGSLERPLVEGKMQTLRGRYEEFGKLFTLRQAELLFQGEIPPSPYLQVVGVNTQAGVEIRAVLSGPLRTPSLRIESSPALPQEDALALLLFGRSSGAISPLQAVQLASGLSRLAGGRGPSLDVMGQVRKFLGVDDLRIQGGEEGGAEMSIGVGKYLGDKVYVETERGSSPESGRARVQIELTPSLSLDASTDAFGASRAGLNWKRDY